MSYLYLCVTVLLISLGQISQKLAARELRLGEGPRTALVSLTGSRHFWLALLALGFGLVSWLLALVELDVSRAYPILGASFVVTTVLSALILEEHVSRNCWIGVALISFGVALMVSS
jgi:undecaprenyl phosphate-alpha-L-ara4N flippase subunit ArnE